MDTASVVLFCLIRPGRVKKSRQLFLRPCKITGKFLQTGTITRRTLPDQHGIFRIKLLDLRQFHVCLRLIFLPLFHQIFWQVSKEHLFQLIVENRLWQKVTEALCQILFPCPRSHIGGQHDDRHLPTEIALIRKHITPRLDPIHFRHHVIQKNQVIGMFFCQTQTLCTTIRLRDLDPALL